MKKKALGTYDIAKIAQVAPITIGRWIDEGKLPFFTTGGGHRRVWDEDLVSFLKSHNFPIPANLKAGLQKTILIAGEDPAERKLIRHTLSKKVEDASFHDAASGFEAGEMVTSLMPQLLVLDLGLPGLDGAAVCRRLRQNKAMKKIRILAISKDKSKEIREKIIKAGADAFITKPFSAQDLISTAKKLTN